MRMALVRISSWTFEEASLFVLPCLWHRYRSFDGGQQIVVVIDVRDAWVRARDDWSIMRRAIFLLARRWLLVHLPTYEQHASVRRGPVELREHCYTRYARVHTNNTRTQGSSITCSYLMISTQYLASRSPTDAGNTRERIIAFVVPRAKHHGLFDPIPSRLDLSDDIGKGSSKRASESLGYEHAMDTRLNVERSSCDRHSSNSRKKRPRSVCYRAMMRSRVTRKMLDRAYRMLRAGISARAICRSHARFTARRRQCSSRSAMERWSFASLA